MSYTPRSHYPLWVGGQEAAGSGADIAIEDPATGDTIAMCATASAEDVDKAIRLGQETFKSGVWSKMAPADRASVVSAPSWGGSGDRG
jgi:acyl-CoA reductase-like NAD-dependent aldehyde dehydrogenase